MDRRNFLKTLVGLVAVAAVDVPAIATSVPVKAPIVITSWSKWMMLEIQQKLDYDKVKQMVDIYNRDHPEIEPVTMSRCKTLEEMGYVFSKTPESIKAEEEFIQECEAKTKLGSEWVDGGVNVLNNMKKIIDSRIENIN